VAALVEMKGYNVNQRAGWVIRHSYGPLRAGVGGGGKLLLRRSDARPGRADPDDRTPLSAAARNGNEEVAKLLLCLMMSALTG